MEPFWSDIHVHFSKILYIWGYDKKYDLLIFGIFREVSLMVLGKGKKSTFVWFAIFPLLLQSQNRRISRWKKSLQKSCKSIANQIYYSVALVWYVFQHLKWLLTKGIRHLKRENVQSWWFTLVWSSFNAGYQYTTHSNSNSNCAILRGRKPRNSSRLDKKRFIITVLTDTRV